MTYAMRIITTVILKIKSLVSHYAKFDRNAPVPDQGKRRPGTARARPAKRCFRSAKNGAEAGGGGSARTPRYFNPFWGEFRAGDIALATVDTFDQ